MANPNGAKGAKFERDCRDFMRDHGFPYVERAYGAGRQDDRGDLLGLPLVAIECKDHAKLNLSGWLDEAEKERENAGKRLGVVLAKRRGKGAREAYCIMTLETFCELVREDD